MNKFLKMNTQENILYNHILLLSRNKLFYTKYNLSDSFQNRIHLIFIHASFLIVKIKHVKPNDKYKDFYQKFFDFIFNKIEQNMREIGYGDVTVNKNMKVLVKSFYNILLNCEKYTNKPINLKNVFLDKYLTRNSSKFPDNKEFLSTYFDIYQSFCFALSPDSVLKGELNFNYN
jgi:cytochrome b pre-mRNA-processing protein 3